MRRPDRQVMDPEVVASLEAIDATLAGEPVDPGRAELAELAVLLRDERPQVPVELSARLDERVARGFARPRASGSRRRRRAWLWAPATGLATVMIAAVVIVAGGSTERSPGSSTSTSSRTAPLALEAPAKTPSSAAGAAAAPPGSGSAAGSPPAVQPPSGGRKVIQSGQLGLTTAPTRMDQVAQEVFDAAGRFKAIVRNSNVNAGGPGSYAQFQLSIPNGSVSQAMAALSALPFAHVASRTDTTQDVTDQYQADVRALADARSLRTSLLKRLANATSQTQIDSLRAQIRDAEASISSDEATLQRLNRQIGYSQVTVSITAGTAPVSGTGGGFTLGQAAHDAGRVLTVAAGAALIAVAALVPVGLLVALVWWGRATVRRRRREQALDLA